MTSLVRAGVLDIAYEEYGGTGAPAAILLHGFPYDVHAYDGVALLLADAGMRVVVPHLRGFGPTRFVDDVTMRSGQQAALAHDLVELMNALTLGSAIVGGYDWGGRAACIVAALWPDRVDGLVTVGGYNVQDIATAMEPVAPEHEATYWYQYYFHNERGRRALETNRDELCELLWRMWSPTWDAASSAFASSAPSLHNPDFVDVVTHSYRHRFDLVAGDPRYDETEERIATMPDIAVPTVVLESGADGVFGPDAGEDRHHFTGVYDLVHLPDIGHNVPQEAPDAFAAAVLRLAAR